MRSIRLQIEDLECSLRELIHQGDGDIYVDLEDVIRLNRKIRTGIDALYPIEVTDRDEEATLCAVLLEAYGQLMCQDCQDSKRRQFLLNRSARLLKKLPVSVLKCRLLVCCYAETYELNLATEAHSIMNSWQEKELSQEELDLINKLQILEDNKL